MRKNILKITKGKLKEATLTMDIDTFKKNRGTLKPEDNVNIIDKDKMGTTNTKGSSMSNPLTEDDELDIDLNEK